MYGERVEVFRMKNHPSAKALFIYFNANSIFEGIELVITCF